MVTYLPHNEGSYRLVKSKSLPIQLVTIPLIEAAISEYVGIKLNVKCKLCMN